MWVYIIPIRLNDSITLTRPVLTHRSSASEQVAAEVAFASPPSPSRLAPVHARAAAASPSSSASLSRPRHDPVPDEEGCRPPSPAAYHVALAARFAPTVFPSCDSGCAASLVAHVRGASACTLKKKKRGEEREREE